MRRYGRHKVEHEARVSRALSQDIAAALFNSSSRFRRQLQTRQELEAIADAVVEHLRTERWQFEKRRVPVTTEMSAPIRDYLQRMGHMKKPDA